MLDFRQRQLVDFVVQHWTAYYVGPSIRELVSYCDWCSNSTSQMHAEVNVLIRDGYLSRQNSRAHALVPLRDCDGTKIDMFFRRADGVEVQLGAQNNPVDAR